MPRILLFTGKGGVGKTTTAAATALAAARRDLRTLVLSTDPAHSLADALDRPLGPEPVAVADNLWAQEIDLYYSMKKHWASLRDLLLVLFKWQGVEKVAAEELAALPGMGEASALLWVEQVYEAGTYDLIVLDAAPTGETLTLLTLPQVTQWWVAKAFPFQKAAIKSVGRAVRATTGIPLDKGYEELDRLFGKLEAIQAVMQDPAVTSVRLVCNPERMVIAEARRAHTYLQLYGYHVDAVVVNRVLPDTEATADGFLAKYVAAQRGYLDEIADSFDPLPILRVPHQGQEVFGLDLLDQIGDTLYPASGDEPRDPAAVLHREPTTKLTEVGDAYDLALRVPFADADEIVAEQFADEVVVQVRNQRRHVALPNFLAYYTLTDAEHDQTWLHLRFEPTTE
ncbi:MAG: TRC40/GET3/ArsA family transport-energizing ATPase [Bacteroidota bacterium]